MKPQINMVGIITTKFDELVTFYKDVLGFPVLLQMDNFVEFENEGVRFAISTAEVMAEATGHEGYREQKQGHSLELAFKANTPEEVDSQYAAVVKHGAIAVKAPADQPWGQRTAFFADPDRNIHEIFADIS